MLIKALLVTSVAMISALSGPPVGQESRFPTDDGFIYPGQPGSEGISEYYRNIAATPHPRRPGGRLPVYEQDAWLVGEWNVTLRDYDFQSPGPGTIQTMGAGTAHIAFTPDQRWIKIDALIAGLNDSFWLGYDDVSRKWLLYHIGKPGGAYSSVLSANAWTRDRASFGPTELVTAGGAKLVDRVTLVRESKDRFRIVTEALMPSGRFVAVHDRVFTRSRLPVGPSPSR